MNVYFNLLNPVAKRERGRRVPSPKSGKVQNMVLLYPHFTHFLATAYVARHKM